MPGWWFTIESTTSKHLIQQFKSAIRSALASKQEVRAMMRARSLLQRFPVAQWIEDLEKLQSTSIAMSNHQRKASTTRSFIRFGSGQNTPTLASPTTSALNSAPNSRPTSRPTSIDGSPRNGSPPNRDRSPPSEGVPEETDGPQPAQPALFGPGHALRRPPLSKSGRYSRASTLSTARNQSPTPIKSRRASCTSTLRRNLSELDVIPDDDDHPEVIPHTPRILRPGTLKVDGQGEFPFPAPPKIDGVCDFGFPAPPDGTRRPGTPTKDSSPLNRGLFPLSPAASIPQTPLETPMEGDSLLTRRSQRLSVNVIVGNSDKDFKLQKVDPFFKDSTDEFYNRFDKMLDTVNPKSSERELCIEDYLSRSEKEWFGRFLRAKLGNSKPGTSATSTHRYFPSGEHDEEGSIRDDATTHERNINAEFQLGNNYTPPKGLKKFLQKKIRDWQIYTFLLAFVSIPLLLWSIHRTNIVQGQIIAANSYQITLLAGENGQAAEKLYVVASIYLAGSLFWWFLYRNVHSVWLLTAPFILYGLAFFIIGMAPYAYPGGGRSWIYNTATGIYALASSSGSFYFALNFGTEGASLQALFAKPCSLILFNRWHACRDLGLQSLCYSRDSTDLCCNTMVLG
jgi:alpha-1,3-glucan synthase